MKISQLPILGSLSGNEALPVASLGVTSQITTQQLAKMGAINVTNRTAMAALSGSTFATTLLEAGYEGLFFYDSTNHWDGQHRTVVPFDSNVTVTSDTATGTLKVTKVAGGSAWNGASKDTVALTGDFEIWFQRNVFAGGGYMFGVDASPATTSTYTDIDFAINTGGAGASAYMNGAKDPVTPDWVWTNALNWLCLRRVGGTITALENTTRTIATATLKHTFSVTSTAPMYFKGVAFANTEAYLIAVMDTANMGTGYVQADPLKGVFVPPATDTTGKSGSWVRYMQGTVRIKPEWFGAKGDGTSSGTGTNDTDAFAAATTLLQTLGGGTLVLSPAKSTSSSTGRIYIVGKQTLGADPTHYSYAPSNIIYLRNFTGHIKIEGNGATLKAASGLRIGTYVPGTGAPYTPPGGGFSDPTYMASPYTGMIDAAAFSGYLEIENLTLDGNEQNLVKSGYYGDTGFQIPCSGLQLLPGSGTILCTNVVCTRHGTDGATYQATVDTRMHELIQARFLGSTFTYNGRNGFSLTGGRGVVFENCKFNHTSRGSIQTNPQYGFDNEPDAAQYSRDITFINCEFLNNVNGGYGGGSGRMQEINFYDCRFSGDPQPGTAAPAIALYITKPGHRLHNCKIVGFYQLTALDTLKYTFSESIYEEGWGTQFFNCIFTNNPNEYYGGIAPTFGGGSSVAQGPILFDNCTWDYNVTAWAATTAYIVNQTVRNGFNYYRCTVAGTSAGAGGPVGTGTSIVDGTVTWTYAGDTVAPSASNAGSDPYRVVHRNCTFYFWANGAANLSGNFDGFTTMVIEAPGSASVETVPQFITGRMIKNGVEQFVGSKTFDWPSVAAGGTSTTTVTVPLAQATDMRSYNATMSTGWGGLIAFCEATAANTVTVRVFNPTAAPIDLASGTLTVKGVR